MARVCEICDKNYKKVTKRSHSMQGSHVKLQPNLQWYKMDDTRIKACARCIKTMAKKKQQA